MHLPPIPRFLVRWTIRLSMLALFVGLPVVLLYLREVGVGSTLKERVAEALSGDQFDTHIGKLLFDPFKGLVAEGVVVKEADLASRPLARVKRLVVSVSLSDLLGGKVTVNFIELDGTDVSIPLGDDEEDRLDLRGVTAQAVFFAGQLRLSYFDARLAGLRIFLSGSLQNPQAFHLKHDEDTGQDNPPTERHRQMISDLVDQLSKLRFGGAGPELRAEINGDLADLSTLRISPISLRSGPIIGKDWRYEGIEASAQYLNGAFTLTQFTLRGKDDTLSASGQFHDGMVNFEVSGSIRLTPFYAFLPRDHPLKLFNFEEAPQFDAFGSINFAATPFTSDITGTLRGGKFAFHGAQMDGLSADFAWKNGRAFARDVRIQAQGGELRADMMMVPGDFRLRFTDTISPSLFAPLLGDKEREFLKLMEFRDPPFVQMELRGPTPNLADLTGTGTLKLGRTALRGSWMDSIQSKLEIANKAVIYRNFTVTMGKGVGTGTFIYDFGAQHVLLQGVNATLPPADVLMWADPKIAEAVRPYRFHQPPSIQAEGLIHLKDPHKNNLSLKVSSPEGLDYDLLKRTLKFGRTLAHVDVIGTKINANVSTAQLMDGDVSMKAVISTDPADKTFGADVDVKKVDFDRLTKLYFDYEASQGLVSGKFRFTAHMGQEEKLIGDGSIKVEDGKVFAIPLLGPLSDIINKIIPGAGYQAARQAVADFQVGDEKIHTNNLAIEGAGFSLIGHGDIFFMSDKMDMSVRINAKGVPGIVLFPVSKLFEYVSTGTVSEPEWRPKIIPRFGGGGNGEEEPAATPAEKTAPPTNKKRDQEPSPAR